MKEFFSIEDVAVMTGLSERTIRNYLADGQLAGEKADGAWRFTPEQFGAFLAQDMVRQSVRAKANSRVYDFLLEERRKESAACLIWDRPVEGGEEEKALGEALLKEVNRLELGCAYRFEKGCARAILTGAPEKLGELLAKLR